MASMSTFDCFFDLQINRTEAGSRSGNAYLVSDSKIRTTPKRSIVEADGIHGACDISEFGGWRNFIASRPAN